MTILFVDDDPDDYQLFCEALRSFEPIAKCLHVTDGQKALDLLHNILPDYIFLDINMPIMGGEETLVKIKKHPSLKQIPVFVYSTTSHNKEIETFKKLGAKEFIRKPDAFDELVQVLKQSIGGLRW